MSANTKKLGAKKEIRKVSRKIIKDTKGVFEMTTLIGIKDKILFDGLNNFFKTCTDMELVMLQSDARKYDDQLTLKAVLNELHERANIVSLEAR